MFDEHKPIPRYFQKFQSELPKCFCEENGEKLKEFMSHNENLWRLILLSMISNVMKDEEDSK